MGALRQIISRFTGGGRRGSATTRTTGGAAGGSQHSQDAKIGRAVRTAVRKLTGRR